MGCCSYSNSHIHFFGLIFFSILLKILQLELQVWLMEFVEKSHLSKLSNPAMTTQVLGHFTLSPLIHPSLSSLYIHHYCIFEHGTLKPPFHPVTHTQEKRNLTKHSFKSQQTFCQVSADIPPNPSKHSFKSQQIFI